MLQEYTKGNFNNASETQTDDLQTLLMKNDLRFKDLQAFHDIFDRTKHFDVDMIRNVAYLTEEVGEVMHAIRMLKKAPEPSSVEAARTHLGEELADCLAYLLKLANYAKIDLQEAYRHKMLRNLNRNWHAVSQRGER